jgi:hypothetical protein
VPDSMSREQRERYAKAVYYAVIERDLMFQLADEFADWWAKSGWRFHREIAHGFANWAAGTFPRAVERDDD